MSSVPRLVAAAPSPRAWAPGPGLVAAMARSFSSSSPVLSSDLDKAKERLSVLTEDPGNDVKLKLYALYKQVRKA